MVLVVGGAGYIGSHFVKHLREQRVPHVVLDNLSAGHRSAVGDSELMIGDLRKRDDLDRVFSSHPIQAVVHFAAHISVGESVREPGKYFNNNTAGVLNLLDAMRDHQVGRLVFSSTAAVYGEPQVVPIPETHPKDPTSPYGLSKWMVEQILEAYDRAHGIRSVRLRYFNAAGADPSGELGEDHLPEEHLIPVAMLAALGRRPSLKLFGTDYPTPDGTCLRDYIHIGDLADAHRRALDHLAEGGTSDAFNLGNGVGFSVREVIETVSSVTGHAVPFEEADRRPGDPARLVASSERAREVLGWQPQRPELRTIVEDAWRWHSSHPNGYGDR